MELSDDDKAFLREMMRSEGWRILGEIIKEQTNILRLEATQREVELEQRLWNSALAKGYDEAYELPTIKTK